MRCLLNCFNGAFDHGIFDHDFNFHLWQEVDDIFGTPIQFGMAFLSAETLGLGNGKSFHADFMQRFLDLVQLERFDDRLDFFSWFLRIPVRSALLLNDRIDDASSLAGFVPIPNAFVKRGKPLFFAFFAGKKQAGRRKIRHLPKI